MEYQSWEPIYRKITKELNISVYDDEKSALILDELINELDSKININFLKNLIQNKKVAIFGAGPSLEVDFEEKMKLEQKHAHLGLLLPFGFFFALGSSPQPHATLKP